MSIEDEWLKELDGMESELDDILSSHLADLASIVIKRVTVIDKEKVELRVPDLEQVFDLVQKIGRSIGNATDGEIVEAAVKAIVEARDRPHTTTTMSVDSFKDMSERKFGKRPDLKKLKRRK